MAQHSDSRAKAQSSNGREAGRRGSKRSTLAAAEAPARAYNIAFDLQAEGYESKEGRLQDVQLESNLARISTLINEACFGPLQGGPEERWKLQSEEDSERIDPSDKSCIITTLQNLMGIRLSLSHRAELWPAPLWDAAITDKHSATQHLLGQLLGEGASTHTPLTVDASTQPEGVALADVIAGMPRTSSKALEHAVTVLLVKARGDIGPAAVREAVQYEGLHGLWELASVDAAHLSLICAQERAAAEAAAAKAEAAGEDAPTPPPTLFDILRDVLASRTSSPRLFCTAATLTWALSVNTYARAEFVRCEIVVQVLKYLSAHATTAKFCTQACSADYELLPAATLSGVPVSAEAGGEGTARRASADPAGDMPEPTESSGAADDAGDEWELQAATVTALLGALSVFMVDSRVRAHFYEPSSYKRSAFLETLFKIASLQIPGDVDPLRQRGKEAVPDAGPVEGDEPVDDPVAEADQAAEGDTGNELDDAAQGGSARATAADGAEPGAVHAEAASNAAVPADYGAQEEAQPEDQAPQEPDEADRSSTETAEAAEAQGGVAGDVGPQLGTTPAHLHRQLAASTIAMMLRRDKTARSFLLRYRSMPLLMDLLASASPSVRLSAAAALSSFVTSSRSAASATYAEIAAVTDIAALFAACVGQITTLLNLEADQGGEDARLSALGEDDTVLASELRAHLQLLLHGTVVAALSVEVCEVGGNMARDLVKLADTCLKLGDIAADTLTVAAAAIGLICSSRDHTTVILFDMQPVRVADVSHDPQCPMGADAANGDTTILALVVSTLLWISGYVAHDPGVWTELLPSQLHAERVGKKVLLPQPHMPQPPPRSGTALAAAAITATAALVALAAHPDWATLPDIAEARYRGPFRDLLLDAGLLPALLDLAQQPWPSNELRRNCQTLVAAGVLVLAAPGNELPRPHLAALVAHVRARMASGDDDNRLLADEAVMLSSALWLLTRNPHNLHYLHRATPLLETATAFAQHLVQGLILTGEDGASGAAGGAREPGRGGAEAAFKHQAERQFGWFAVSDGGSLVQAMEHVVLVLWRLLCCVMDDRKFSVPANASCYGHTETTWWQLQMNLKAQLPEVAAPTAAALQALVLVVRLLITRPDLQHLKGPLSCSRQLATRALWLCQRKDVVIHDYLIEHFDLGDAVMQVMADSNEEQDIVVLCVCIATEIATAPENMRYLGGVTQYCDSLLRLLISAIRRGDSSGRGCWIHLLSVAARAVARLSFLADGRKALVRGRGVRQLLAVLRTELDAFEALHTDGYDGALFASEEVVPPQQHNARNSFRPSSSKASQKTREAPWRPASAPKSATCTGVGGEARGSKAWERAALQSPLHVINDVALDAHVWVQLAEDTVVQRAIRRTRRNASQVALRSGKQQSSETLWSLADGITHAPEDWTVGDRGTTANLHEAHRSGVAIDSGEDESDVNEDGHIGMLCCWTLLNLSSYPPAQPQIGRYGLFTMMGVARILGAGPRGWLACNVLRNVQWHYKNASLFYHAELRVKYDLLLEASGLTVPVKVHPIPKHVPVVVSAAELRDENGRVMIPAFGAGMDPADYGAAMADANNAQAGDQVRTSHEDEDGEGAAAAPDPRLTFIRWQDPTVDNALQRVMQAGGTSSVTKSKALLPSQLISAMTTTGPIEDRDPETHQKKLEAYSATKLMKGQFMRERYSASMRKRAAVLWESSAEQRQTNTERVRAISPARPVTVRESLTAPALPAVNNPLPRPATARPATRGGAKGKAGSSRHASRPMSADARPGGGLGRAGESSQQGILKVGAKTSVEGEVGRKSTKAKKQVMQEAAGRIGVGFTTRDTDGKTGVGYKVSKLELPNGETISGDRMRMMASSKSGRGELETQIHQAIYPNIAQERSQAIRQLWASATKKVATTTGAVAAAGRRKGRTKSEQSAMQMQAPSTAKRRKFKNTSGEADPWHPRIECFAQDPSCPKDRPLLADALLRCAAPEELSKSMVVTAQALVDKLQPATCEEMAEFQPDEAELRRRELEALQAKLKAEAEAAAGPDDEAEAAELEPEIDLDELGPTFQDNYGAAQKSQRFQMPDATRLKAPPTQYEQLCVGQHALRLSAQKHATDDDLKQRLGLCEAPREASAKTSTYLQRYHPGAQRPTTVMNVQACDVVRVRADTAKPRPEDFPGGNQMTEQELILTAKALEDEESAKFEAQMLAKLQESVLQSQPLSVVLAHDAKHPKTRFQVHSKVLVDSSKRDRILTLTEHHDGARFCEDLFGHFLLPNGRLAHFYYHGATHVKGRLVSMLRPPELPSTFSGSFQTRVPLINSALHGALSPAQNGNAWRACAEWLPPLHLPPNPALATLQYQLTEMPTPPDKPTLSLSDTPIQELREVGPWPLIPTGMRLQVSPPDLHVAVAVEEVTDTRTVTRTVPHEDCDDESCHVCEVRRLRAAVAAEEEAARQAAAAAAEAAAQQGGVSEGGAADGVSAEQGSETLEAHASSRRSLSGLAEGVSMQRAVTVS